MYKLNRKRLLDVDIESKPVVTKGRGKGGRQVGAWG